jgi:hypothetical protein
MAPELFYGLWFALTPSRQQLRYYIRKIQRDSCQQLLDNKKLLDEQGLSDRILLAHINIVRSLITEPAVNFWQNQVKSSRDIVTIWV